MLTPGWSDKADLRVIPPTPADIKDLTVYHDRDYVDFIMDPVNASQESVEPRRAEFGIEEVQISCLHHGHSCVIAVGLSSVQGATDVCPNGSGRVSDW